MTTRLNDGAAVPLDEQSIFRSLHAAYPDALLVVDASGAIVLANAAAETLLGYGALQLVGMNVDQLVPDLVRARHSAYRRAYAGQPRVRPMGGTQTELVARRGDGTEVTVEIALSPLQSQGLPLVVAAIRDVGAFPRVRQALQRARYSEMLAQVGRVAVDSLDPQGLLDQVPLVATQALAATSVAVWLQEPGREGLRLASASGLPAGRTASCANTHLVASVLARGRPTVLQDMRDAAGDAPSGLPEGAVSAAAIPISDRGHTTGVVVVCSDQPGRFGDDEVRFLESLSNLLAATLQRAHSEEALNHAQKLETVGQLTGGIAHDFNNLLTIIQGNLQLVEEHPALQPLDDLQDLLGAAARAARRGAELTGKLLAFSRRQVLRPVAVDIEAMLQSLAAMLRRTLDQRIRIELDVQPVAPVLADAGQLESALLNIAINARDAMPDGGTLTFGASRTTLPEALRGGLGAQADPGATFVALAVRDTGSGMGDAVRERAFEPFFTTKEPGRGTGLGLSTVYGFAKQSKGAVALESVEGAGTTVTLYLPSALEDEDDELVPAAAAVSIPPGLRVLLVEDDAGVRDVALSFLKAFGCETVAAPGAREALALVSSFDRLDLVVTDIALGAGLRGPELAHQLQAARPEIKVLLMSGFPAELVDADREAPPSWALLQKPYTREELRAAIGRALG